VLDVVRWEVAVFEEVPEPLDEFKALLDDCLDTYGVVTWETRVGRLTSWAGRGFTRRDGESTT